MPTPKVITINLSVNPKPLSQLSALISPTASARPLLTPFTSARSLRKQSYNQKQQPLFFFSRKASVKSLNSTTQFCTENKNSIVLKPNQIKKRLSVRLLRKEQKAEQKKEQRKKQKVEQRQEYKKEQRKEQKKKQKMEQKVVQKQEYKKEQRKEQKKKQEVEQKVEQKLQDKDSLKQCETDRDTKQNEERTCLIPSTMSVESRERAEDSTVQQINDFMWNATAETDWLTTLIKTKRELYQHIHKLDTKLLGCNSHSEMFRTIKLPNKLNKPTLPLFRSPVSAQHPKLFQRI